MGIVDIIISAMCVVLCGFCAYDNNMTDFCIFLVLGLTNLCRFIEWRKKRKSTKK